MSGDPYWDAMANPESEQDGLREQIAALRAEVARLKLEEKLLTHKVITCGVAASHPDAALSSRKTDYGGPWDSPQAERVREVRARADAAEAEVERLTGLLRTVKTEAERQGDRAVAAEAALRKAEERIKGLVLTLNEYQNNTANGGGAITYLDHCSSCETFKERMVEHMARADAAEARVAGLEKALAMACNDQHAKPPPRFAPSYYIKEAAAALKAKQ
jgi:chromosome segregation ATPase